MAGHAHVIADFTIYRTTDPSALGPSFADANDFTVFGSTGGACISDWDESSAYA